MDIKEFNEKYNFHDSLVDSIVYDEKSKTVTIVFDFCYWMQPDYKKEEQENGLLRVTFENVVEYDGIQGIDKSDWWSVLDDNIEDGRYHLLVESVEKGDIDNPEYYDVYVTADNVVAEDLRNQNS